MSYDNPIHAAYYFPTEVDFGDTSGVETHQISGPSGHKGRVVDISVSMSEVAYHETTAANVLVGINGNTDSFAKLEIPTGQADNSVCNKADDTDAIIAADIPAGTAVHTTFTEATGGSITGKGFVTIFIDWFK